MTFAEAQELLERYVAGDQLTEEEKRAACCVFITAPPKLREEMLARWADKWNWPKERRPR